MLLTLYRKTNFNSVKPDVLMSVLGALAKFLKTTVGFVIPICLSVRLSLDGF